MFIPATGLPEDLAEYLKKYRDKLSRPQQEHFQTYVTGLIICEGKRTVCSMDTECTPIGYGCLRQVLQHLG